MPELPDVEVFRGYLDSTSLNQKIEKVQIYSPEILKGISASEMEIALKDNTFESTRRHGKYLFSELDTGRWLVFHFGMTGFLKYFKEMEKEPPHDRMLIEFLNGYHLSYDCQRKLGEIRITENVDKFTRETNLGIDALDIAFDPDWFREKLNSQRGSIKSTLMKQEFVAGIGNIYADEILFQSGVHPKARPNQLNDKTVKKLFTQIGKVLNKAIECEAQPERFPQNFIIPRRRTDQKCPKCGGKIEILKISGRSAYYCPKCQKG